MFLTLLYRPYQSLEQIIQKEYIFGGSYIHASFLR